MRGEPHRRTGGGAVGEDKQTEAIGEGLAAIAYALLDVAQAIRENTGARE
ncbi:hypothetical protein [Streptomyces sp. NPDC056512]